MATTAEEYVPSYACTVCAESTHRLVDLDEFVVEDFVRDEDEVPVTTGKYGIFMCSTCQDRLGAPLQVRHRPYQTDLCVFEKSDEPVELENSGPKDD